MDEVREGFRFRAPFVLLFTGTTLVFWLVRGRVDGVGAAAELSTDAPTFEALLTSHLFHVSGWHVSANLLAILAAGGWLESRYGTLRFTVFYAVLALGASLSCWAFGTLAQVAGVHGGLPALSFGASGVAIGCLTALAVKAPELEWPHPWFRDTIWLRHALWAFVFLAAAGLAWIDQTGVVVWTNGDAEGAAWIFLLPQISGVVLAILVLAVEPWAERRALEAQVARAERERERVLAIRQKVDGLLAKISLQGYGSLSADERSFLRYASKHFKREE